MRLLVPTVLHVFGTFMTLLAFLLSIFGHINHDKKTLYSAIFYILGGKIKKFFYKMLYLGLIVLVGILQIICIVDDEMYPRMKPNTAGEPSGFNFHYGNLNKIFFLLFLILKFALFNLIIF